MKMFFLFVAMLVAGLVMWSYRGSDYVPGIFLMVGVYFLVAPRRPTHGFVSGMVQMLSQLGGLGLAGCMGYSLWRWPHYRVVYGCGLLCLLLALLSLGEKEFTRDVPRRNVVWGIVLAAFLGFVISITILVVR